MSRTYLNVNEYEAIDMNCKVIDIIQEAMGIVEETNINKVSELLFRSDYNKKCPSIS